MKKLLITGASTGIGAETARLLAPGNLVFVHYASSRRKAEGVAREVEQLGGRAVLLQADLTTEAACIGLVEALGAHADSLDVLVNNAGGLVRRQAARGLTWDLMLETFSLNAFSAMKIASLCIPLLEKGTDPSIVNVTSVVVRHGGPTATIYAASKGRSTSSRAGSARSWRRESASIPSPPASSTRPSTRRSPRPSRCAPGARPIRSSATECP